MPTGPRKTGEFCWINILTSQPAPAREFFAALLGWSYVEIPGMGHRMQVGGHDVGGIFDLEGPGTPPGTPPHIGVMIKVEHADATCERVKALGGSAQPPFDVMTSGRLAVCTDPCGAGFDLWQPIEQPGSDADRTLHGAPSWSECLTTDTARGAKFYTELFGWSAEVMAMPGMDYTVFKLGTEPVGGMMAITPEMGPMPPHWATYITVNDTDATAALAVKLGGSLCVPPMDIPNIGRFCGIVSPQGVMFFAIKYATPA